MTFASISQTTDSVTCLPNIQLRKVIKDLENCKIFKEELEFVKESNQILLKRLEIKDSVIQFNNDKETQYKNLLSNKETIIEYQKQMIKNLEIIKKEHKKRNRSNIIKSGIAGVLIGGITTILIVK